jgi:alpha/beta superfamily hydrolase
MCANAPQPAPFGTPPAGWYQPEEQQSVHATGAIERVEFYSRRGVRLVGAWHRAATRAGVVLCHGMEACKEGTKSVRLAEDLAGRGINALRFDFSYVGESEGAFLDLTVSGEVEDLAGAWAYARGRLAGPLGLIGSSLGGTVALLFAAGQPEVAALATIAAVAHPGRQARALSAAERARWRREGVYDLHGVRVGAAFLDDVERLDVPAALVGVRCPVLLGHGTDDAVVPCADADRIAAAVAGPCEVRRYAGADHRFSDAGHLDAMLADAAGWMADRLADATAAASGRAEAERT